MPALTSTKANKVPNDVKSPATLPGTKAAKAPTNQGFHIDQALNGVAVATWRNQPNHNNYNNLILDKLILDFQK